MGNIKHLHRYRHPYVRKTLPEKVNESDLAANPTHCDINGSRIINMHKLLECFDELNAHSARCSGSIFLEMETRYGLASILSSRCSTCGHAITLQSSEKVIGPNGVLRWEINLDAIWGQMFTGTGNYWKS